MDKDQAPLEQPPVDPPNAGSTVGPDYPGVTGTPAEGTRDEDRVKAEQDDDEDPDA